MVYNDCIERELCTAVYTYLYRRNGLSLTLYRPDGPINTVWHKFRLKKARDNRKISYKSVDERSLSWDLSRKSTKKIIQVVY